jgi:hypothetical protein
MILFLEINYIPSNNLKKTPIDSQDCKVSICNKEFESMNLNKVEIKYRWDDRQKEIQPTPEVQLEWLIECLLHKLPFKLDNTRLINLKTLVDKEKWVPFYWDRKAQWENLLSMEDE